MINDRPNSDYQGQVPVMGEYNDRNLNQVWMIEYIR